jgi:hypothetical protein
VNTVVRGRRREKEVRRVTNPFSAPPMLDSGAAYSLIVAFSQHRCMLLLKLDYSSHNFSNEKGGGGLSMHRAGVVQRFDTADGYPTSVPRVCDKRFACSQPFSRVNAGDTSH